MVSNLSESSSLSSSDGLLSFSQKIMFWYRRAWYALGLFHLRRERLHDAEKALNHGLSGDVSDRAAMIANIQKAQVDRPDLRYFYIGEVWRALNNASEALEYYQMSLALSPDNPLTHNARGLVLFETGATSEAIAAFSTSLEHDDNFDEAAQNRGRAANALLRQSMGIKLFPEDVAKKLKEDASPPFIPPPGEDYIYCPQYRFVYASIPKVACTSFKRLLYATFKNHVPDLPSFAFEPGHSRGQEFQRLFETAFTLKHYSQAEAVGILSSPEVFKFTFVRNPLERILSGYLDKIISPWPHSSTLVEKVVRTIRGRDADPLDLTFREFVEYLARTEDMDLNSHWRPMNRLVDVSKMDFIGHLETVERDFNFIRQKLGLPYELPISNSSKPKMQMNGKRGALADSGRMELAKLQGRPPTELFYDFEMEQAIRERFKIDFEAFGYSNIPA